MARISKNRKNALQKFDVDVAYAPEQAIAVLKDVAYASFDESVEVHYSLGIDPRHADQLVRGTLVLPNGSGKSLRVVVLTNDSNTDEFIKSGAIAAGFEDVIEKISGGWLDFDLLLASPVVMPKLGKLGRLLGARGLMPSPKSGTVTTDLMQALTEFLNGKVEFRNDKEGNLHLIMGKKSFASEKLLENFMMIHSKVLKLKPQKAKGIYLKSISICTTMSPSVKIHTHDNKWKEEVNA